MSYLDRLLDATRARVDETKQKITTSVLEQRIAAVPPPRDFSGALRGGRISLIAEMKRSSPIKGTLNETLNAAAMAELYAEGGAAAISVLTEPDFFHGSLDDLEAAAAAGRPLLRKDFIVDEFQVLESRAGGADAVLVIVRALGEDDDDLLRRLITAVQALGMHPLVEVHDEFEVKRALDAGATLIGVNHRDLRTFEVDPERTAKLAPMLPDDCILVSLSGVRHRAEVAGLEASGADAVLVGETLVTSADPVAKMRELLGQR